jgi:hypothetical protein
MLEWHFPNHFLKRLGWLALHRFLVSILLSFSRRLTPSAWAGKRGTGNGGHTEVNLVFRSMHALDSLAGAHPRTGQLRRRALSFRMEMKSPRFIGASYSACLFLASERAMVGPFRQRCGGAMARREPCGIPPPAGPIRRGDTGTPACVRRADCIRLGRTGKSACATTPPIREPA